MIGVGIHEGSSKSFRIVSSRQYGYKERRGERMGAVAADGGGGGEGRRRMER